MPAQLERQQRPPQSLPLSRQGASRLGTNQCPASSHPAAQTKVSSAQLCLEYRITKDVEDISCHADECKPGVLSLAQDSKYEIIHLGRLDEHATLEQDRGPLEYRLCAMTVVTMSLRLCCHCPISPPALKLGGHLPRLWAAADCKLVYLPVLNDSSSGSAAPKHSASKVAERLQKCSTLHHGPSLNLYAWGKAGLSSPQSGSIKAR